MQRRMAEWSIGGNGIRLVRPTRRNREEEFALKVWAVGWGLLFMVLLTLFTVWGPRTAYSNVAPAPAASETVVQVVK